MIQQAISLILVPLLLLPQGVCVCRSHDHTGHGVAFCDDGDDFCCEESDDRQVDPGQEEIGRKNKAERHHHEEPIPLHRHDEHSPGCPVAKNIGKTSSKSSGKPLVVRAWSLDVSLYTSPIVLPVGHIPDARSRSTPLYLTLRALLI
jgi:hypothetical protein